MIEKNSFKKHITLFLIFIFIQGYFYATPPIDSTHIGAQDYEILASKYYKVGNYKIAFEYLQIANSLTKIKLEKALYENTKNLTQRSGTSDSYKRTLLKNKIHTGILIFILIDILGLFFFLYLEKRKAYMLLVKKNMDWAQSNSNYKKFLAFQTELHQPCENSNYEPNSNLDSKEQDVLVKLIQLLEDQKIYLHSDLSVQEIAKTLNTNRNCLSKVVNTYFGKSFPALLNEYRIKEAIKFLSDKKTDKFKLEAIGEMSGYKNRQVFHSAFKKETGLTPNDFRQMSTSKDFNEDL